MDMDVERDGSTLIATPKGRIDGLNAGEFSDALTAAIETGDRLLLVDFSQMSYISSAGLRVILSQAKAMGAQEGKLDICAPPENILEVLRISGFDQILSIHESRAAALATQ